MKRFELYFNDLTPAAQKEWVDTFGEKPMEFVPMHLFEVIEVDDYDSMEVDDKCSDCKTAQSASGEEFDAWL